MIRQRLCHWFVLFASLFAMTNGEAVQAQSSDKLKLSYLAPDDGIFFFAHNGWSASDPKSTNRTEKLFAEQSVQDFATQLMDEVSKLINNAAAAQGNEEAKVAAEAGPKLAKIVLTHPGAMYLKSFKAQDNPEVEFAVVVEAEKDGSEAIAAFKKLTDLIPREGPQGAIEEKIGDATFLRPKEYRQNEPEIRIGYRASQLIVTLGKETPKEVVAKLQKPGKAPAWISKTMQELPVERPSMLIAFNAQKLISTLQPVITDPMASKVLEALGINKLKSFASVSGLDKTGMHSMSLITTDGTPSGLFDLIPDKPIGLNDFKGIPASAINATVTRFDLAYLYDKALKLADQIDPNVRGQVEQTLAAVEPQLGFSVKSDFLDGLGDTWSFYSSSTEPGVSFVPGFVITASVRKQEGVAKALNVVVMAARAALANAGPQAPFSIQDFSARNEKGYRIVINGLPIPVQPTWVLT